jgi:hypothetical protein
MCTRHTLVSLEHEPLGLKYNFLTVAVFAAPITVATKQTEYFLQNTQNRTERAGYLQLNKTYQIKPFDLEVFKGDDFISRVIQVAQNLLVEQKDQVNRRWSHVGVIVDRNVLPLPYMEPGKLYVYESVLSGTAFGYQYSSVQSVDHPLSKLRDIMQAPKSAHL